MRTIKVKLLTQSELVTVETNARTFGELKSEAVIMNQGIDWESSKFIGRTSKTTYDLDEAVLSESDTIFFVTPTKTKSGAGLSYAAAKEIIRGLVETKKISPINWAGKTTEDLNNIIDNYNSIEDDEIQLEEAGEEEVLIEQVRLLMKKAMKKLKRLGKVSSKDTTKIVDHLALYKQELAEFITKDELTLEAEHLSTRF